MMHHHNSTSKNHSHFNNVDDDRLLEEIMEPQDASASSSATGALPLPHDMVLDRLRAMLYQETRGYEYDAYFPDPFLHHPPQQEHQWTPLNHEWREKICQWTYNVVDTYDLPREIVALSLNYFDRYLATRGNQCNGTLALLVSLTTLHIAMKVHSSTGTFKLQKLAELSRGQFGPGHIEQMEWQIMSALKFNLHPPTLFAFVSYYLMLFPQQLQPPQTHYGCVSVGIANVDVVPRHAVRKELFEVAIYMAELSVCDSFFVPFPESIVALAALSIVMEDMSSSKLPPSCKANFWEIVQAHLDLAHLPNRTKQLQEAKDRLRHMFQATTGAAAAGSSSGQQASGQPANSAAANGYGGSSNQSTTSLTSSPTSAAEMMAMEDWNDPAQYQSGGNGNVHGAASSSNMDCGSSGLVPVQHPDTEDEGDDEEEGGSFRYSPSPPMAQVFEPAPLLMAHHQPHAGFKHHHHRHQHHQQHYSQQHHPQYHRHSINSSSPTSFLARTGSQTSLARISCSPIVAGVQ